MDTNLGKIVDYLLLKSSYMCNVGLFHGKMGVAVTLFLHARKNQDSLLEEYAWDLFSQVYEGLHDAMPLGLEEGLAGIGYGTVVLCKNGFGDCDLNSILVELDTKIMEYDPRRVADQTLRSGMDGVRLYIRERSGLSCPMTTFDTSYLEELGLERLAHKEHHREAIPLDILEKPEFGIDDYPGQSLGIDRGMSYYVLNALQS